MDLERAVTARVGGHLEQFVFSEDVEVADVSGSLAQLGVFGPHAADVVGRVLGEQGSPLSSADLEGLAVLANRTSAWHGAAATVVRRDDFGELGFDLLVAAEALGCACTGDQRRRRRRCRASGRRRLPDRERPTGLRQGHDRGHDSTRGRHRGPRDQPDEGVLRRTGNHHPRSAPRPRTRRATARRPDARARGGGAELTAQRSAAAIARLARSPVPRCRPRLGRPIALGYVHRDFVEPGTPLTVVDGAQSSPAVVTRLPFVGSALDVS